jgi:SPOR domain
VLDAKGVLEPYREPRQGRGWLTLLLGMLVFAVFGVVVGYAYFKGMPGIGGEPPLIRAETEPYRRTPSERGGLEVANVSSSIVSVLRPNTPPPRVEQLLPQEPPPALDANEPGPEPDAAAAAAASAAEDAPGPSAPAPLPPEPVVADLPDPVADPPDAAGEPAGAPGDSAAEAADEAASPTPTVTVPMPLPKPTPPRQLAAREPPATISRSRRAAAPVAELPRATTRQVSPPPPARAPARGAGPQRLARVDPSTSAAGSPLRSGTGGSYRLQLTAVRSEAGLTRAWADLRQRYPRALATVAPKVERTETGSGPLFRLQAGPFASRESAVNACGTIRSSGGQCFIVGPIEP